MIATLPLNGLKVTDTYIDSERTMITFENGALMIIDGSSWTMTAEGEHVLRGSTSSHLEHDEDDAPY